MANRTQNQNLEKQGLETGDESVDSAARVTLAETLKALRNPKNSNIDVAGQKVAKPELAYKKLSDALKQVKSYFGKNLKINLDEISFKKFAGNQVGESTEEGAFVDPVMLMHPAIRLAHVIAHELAHDKKKIMNEGLVEAYVHAFFGEDEVTHSYEMAVDTFEQFAKKCSGKKDQKETVKKIYEHYYSGRFEKIYEMFEKNYLKKSKNRAERDEAFKLFRTVFPELHYVTKNQPAGYFGLDLPEEV